MLIEQGLNLFAVLRRNDLPQSFGEAVQRAQIKLRNYDSLILIGHAGNDMWRQLKNQGRFNGPNPVDDFSRFHAARFINDYLDGCPHQWLYPGDVAIPLQRLGAMAGWQHSSPLGVGVNEHFGPWFGYRAALLVQPALPEDLVNAGESPCDSCLHQPCISSCPAQALSKTAPPQLSACVDYRLQQHSPCKAQCLARLACPVGAEHRYDHEQLRYFYRRSLDSIKQHMSGRRT